ncbi:MAG: hypothetical protein E7004_05225 [Alphaproteobacteria bacterium]|nr:hypothetical protein [Alphaproteobacteria bacterium]
MTKISILKTVLTANEKKLCLFDKLTILKIVKTEFVKKIYLFGFIPLYEVEKSIDWEDCQND